MASIRGGELRYPCVKPCIVFQGLSTCFVDDTRVSTQTSSSLVCIISYSVYIIMSLRQISKVCDQNLDRVFLYVHSLMSY